MATMRIIYTRKFAHITNVEAVSKVGQLLFI